MESVTNMARWYTSVRIQRALDRMEVDLTEAQRAVLADEAQRAVADALRVRDELGAEALWLLGDEAIEVLRRAAAGQVDTEIARGMGMSAKTPRKVMARIFGVLRAHNRTHAVALAIRWGLVEPGLIEPAPRGTRSKEPARTVPRWE